MEDDEINACYERIGALRAFVRKPRLMDAGNELRFYVGNENPDVDLALALGAKRYHDCEVLVTIHLLKDASGKDLRRPAPSKNGKPYGELAQLLYMRGFFNAAQVQGEIGLPIEGATGQSAWAGALAQQLGYDSMGFVPPPALLDWAKEHSLDWMLPAEYGGGRDVEG